MTVEEAFELGKKAETIKENPFWKNWPRETEETEKDLARAFIKGWCSVNEDIHVTL